LAGAHAIARYMTTVSPDLSHVGLCDANEEPIFRRHLEEVYVCVPDLEGELIDALGAERVLEMVDANFATLQKQVIYRDRPLEAQLRTYLRGRSGNKIRYARLFVDALDLRAVPDPLERVLADDR